MRHGRLRASAPVLSQCCAARTSAWPRSVPRLRRMSWEGVPLFNLGGNKYRLVVGINHDYATIYTRFIGTHAQYDQIDAKTI